MSAGMRATADTIVATQRHDGAIPADHRGDLDPWNHIEAAMGLDAAGRHDSAARAYRWLVHTQNSDGSWYARYHHGRPADPARDASHAAYAAVGTLHHYLSTQDSKFADTMWPTIDRAITFALTLQRSTGEFSWRLPDDRASPVLLAGNSSIHHALRSAITLSTITEHDRPQWIAAADRLRDAITSRPELFAPKPHAMDWYYPALGAALDNDTAQDRLDAHWYRFVVPDRGVRCVHHEPWITTAETAELALTLAAHGDHHRATRLLESLTRLRHADGSYWTGHNYATDTIWPRERTTWTSGAVLLATAAVTNHHPTLTTFCPPSQQHTDHPRAES